MNIAKRSEFVSGTTLTSVFTATENTVININITNTSNIAGLVTLYISDNDTPILADMIDNKNHLEVGDLLLRCGEPIAKGESVYVLLSPANIGDTGFGISVRTSGLYDTPIA